MPHWQLARRPHYERRRPRAHTSVQWVAGLRVPLNGRGLRVLDGQYRTRSQSHYLRGHAAQDHVLQSGAAMGSHDDEIGIPLSREADDGVGRASDRDLDFPRVPVGLRYEVTESGQRLGTVILAYNRRIRCFFNGTATT